MATANPSSATTEAGDTRFVRLLNFAFRRIGHLIAEWPWIFIVTSTILTMFASIKIPLTEMNNDVSDYTPYAARSRKELQVCSEPEKNLTFF